MLTLSTTFENGIGRRHSFSIKDPDRNKPAAEIRASLEKLASLNLFEKDGISMFTKVISAKFVETIETPIFDLRNEEDFEAAPAAPVQTIDVQPESVQMEEVPAVEAPATNVQTASIQVEQPSRIASQSAAALMQASAPHAAPTKSAPIQTQDKPVSQGGTLQIRVTVPEDYQPNQMSDEELEALLRTGLPEGANLEDFSLDDIVITMPEGADAAPPLIPNATVTDQLTSAPAGQSVEMIEEVEEDPAEEKRSGWFPKRKKGTNPLAGFSADKRKRKKAINRWKREKNKDKKD
ncbi:DUF2922 family protein [Enterococcus sp. 669A]|uniref:DUF2922 family protein n=1 Tax=Candidatus Enterococcus moelleringii TaxID=2815325 RepID=A0ABS3LCQ6_9ENTE|nr:DUF2922 domain-containing protein [Enterococcus sp. 669A]MBO1307415.1 DUF2922 family protein [Enterococcus sp. 669A]